ncbi:hypothetical protein HPP92_013456 [Vanilla planifolia]|uniref:Uncharacterized protein n=1 Tax=Vanilla planifolia TaxID=51239 RepID=A0A835R3K0_VANPL|nr:hypothetical protein HPP92_013456 [Vanilla planifolia]
MESVALIDICLEDDLLIPSTAGGIGLEASSTLETEGMKETSKQMEQSAELSDSPQQKRRKADRFNLRKSLAWDNEFFTSEGVLNSEELAIINGTYSKTVGISLAGIPEELRKSTESTSTLDSECRALENLEARLFQNLPTLIQNSFDNSSRTANTLNSDKKKAQVMPVPHRRTLKKTEFSSKAKASLSNGEAKTSTKPPKDLCKTISSGLHKNDPSTKQIKRNTVKALAGTVAKRQPIRVPAKTHDDLVMASRLIPSKGSAFNAQLDSKLVSASCSLSSRNITRSVSDSRSSSSLEIKRNAVKDHNHSLPKLSSKIPARTARSKTKPKDASCDPNSSANSTSVHSSISPASSANSFSSEWSSSTSTSIKLITSTDGSDSGFPSSHSQAASSGIVAPQKSGAKSLGLRMPRPRVGYFDKEKNPVCDSNKYLQTSLRNSFTMNNRVMEIAAANKRQLKGVPTIRAGTHSSAPPNHISKPAESQAAHNNVNKHQEHVPKLKKGSSLRHNSSMIVTETRPAPDRVEKDPTHNSTKWEQSNLLQPKFSTTTHGIRATGDQCFNHQPLIVHNQLEQTQNQLNVADRNTEKENLWPSPNGEGLAKSLLTEDQNQAALVESIGEMVSSLSLSEAKDVAPMINVSP